MNAETPVRTDLTTEEWRADLAALAREIPARHANAFHTIDREGWDAAVAAVDERLQTLSPTTAPVALRELAARVGDGHTAVRLPDTRRLPIGMFWVGDELRIVETDAAHAELLGARVLRIGDRSAHDARRVAQRLIARENRWADLRLRTNATLVGEPIGERPNSYQEVRFFALPNSGLRVGVSVEYYEALPGAGNPDAIEPDVSAPPTWRRFRAGEDDALEWIRSRPA